MARIPESTDKVLARLGPAVVYVETNGDAIGSAFHIGERFFVTARHVVHKRKITKVGRVDVTQVVHFHDHGQPMYPSRLSIYARFPNTSDGKWLFIFKYKDEGPTYFATGQRLIKAVGRNKAPSITHCFTETRQDCNRFRPGIVQGFLFGLSRMNEGTSPNIIGSKLVSPRC